ncbi:site-specific integrase, partial [Pseudovibrio sp. JE062]|uniref:site-specific integrase n=1 Tax=Pseudovibrio sp. JE062 TaxID=439495 RepID=UPI000186C392
SATAIPPPSRKPVARELQRASIQASKAIAERNQGELIDTPNMPHIAPASAPIQAQEQLSDVIEEWAAEKARTSWKGKTEKEHRTWMSNFISVVGDKQLTEYTKADARAFKAMLLKLPANWVKQKEIAGLNIAEAAEKASKWGLQPMSDLNVNKIIGFVAAFWNWAEANYDEAPANLFKGLKIKIKQSARDQRDPFTSEELKAIFSAPLYTGCKSLRFWKQEGSLIPKDAGAYWVPLIGLYTGARLGEIIQLYTTDIREQNGVWYFDINEDGSDKQLKTVSSKRQIPIHAELIKEGLLDLYKQRKAEKQQRLFPDLKMGEDGYYSSPFSKYFKRFLESVSVKRDKNAFHSFRHCFEDACRHSDISKEIMDALQGHTEKGMAGRYGSGFKLEKLAEAMGRLRYGVE